jgi:predicted dehydrogenase
MKKKISVGIIGTSYWADGFYLPSLKSHPNCHIKAICGRNRMPAEKLAKKYDIKLVFTDYQKLLKNGQLDAVVIATPDDLHYPMVMKALNAGLHVLCEKPMALNTLHAKEMLDKANSVGVKHMIMFTNRWFPHYQYLKHLVDNGYLDQFYHAHIKQFSSNPQKPETYLWYYDARRSNGILSVAGSHLIDMLLWLVGDISSVNANLFAFVKRNGPDGKPMKSANDSAFLQLRFKNSGFGSIHISAVSHTGGASIPKGIGISLYGREGSLESFGEAGSHPPTAKLMGIKVDQKSARRLLVPTEYYEGASPRAPFEVFLKNSVGPRLFVDAILHDTPLKPSFKDGYKVQKIIQAAMESDKKGSSVAVGSIS